ncbi:hypothetical protein ACEPAH_3960 [Sanghuangporus vaninii]
MANELEALRDLVSSSVSKVLDVCERTNKDFPSLNKPVHPSEFSPEGIRNHPAVSEHITVAIAAATQLVATLQNPLVNLWNSSFRFTLPVCLSIAEATNVAEIIRDNGPKGMHVDDIAAKSGVDPKKLERVLRFLATNHYFREVKEKTFAHNLLSSLLDTGKDMKDCFGPSKHANTSGFAAVAGLGADELLLAAAAFKDIMLDPATAFSEEVTDSGTQRALNTKLPLWGYYELPENRFRADRFNLVMSGANSMHPNAILAGFNWDEVQNGVLVDIGSGTGHVSLEIAKKFPDIQVVLEDRASVIENAKIHWKEHLASHITDGKVHFIPFDFFDDQPPLPGPPDIFLLRWILHDWPDKYAIHILKKLRKAAIPGKTKLVIIENLMSYACEPEEVPVKEVGAVTASSRPPPVPLLPNLGGANLLPYAIDIIVSTTLNAGERTVHGFIDLLEASGWRFSHIRRESENYMLWASIVAEPNVNYEHKAGRMVYVARRCYSLF